MKVTREFLCKKFKEFNRDFFNNKLECPVFEINKTKRALGMFCHPTYCRSATIKISDYYDRTEEEICNTLLHEMIHYYIHHRKLKDTSLHGKVFMHYASLINKYGWEIGGVNHKPLMPKESKKLNVVLYHHIKKDYYFIFAYANGKEELYRNYFRKYADIFDNVAFTTTDDIKYADLALCRNRIRGRYLDTTEYQNLIKINKFSIAM